MATDEWRFVLIRNMESDPKLPQTFHIRAGETVASLLSQWAAKNEECLSKFAFLTETGLSIDDCHLVSDLPLLAPGLNYVDLKCFKTKSAVFQIYGFPDIHTSVKITVNLTLEKLEKKIKTEIPCIEDRPFVLLSSDLQPLLGSHPVVEQLGGEEGCWIDLVYMIECLDIMSDETNEIKCKGSDVAAVLLRYDSPKAQRILYFDENQKEHVLEENQNIVEMFKGDLIKTEITVLRTTKMTVLVDDACEGGKLVSVDVWPTDQVGSLLKSLFRQRYTRYGEVRHVFCDGKQLDPSFLFCDVTDQEGIPILHLSKQIEVRYCDKSSETNSVLLHSNSPVLDLRKSVMNHYKRCNDEIVLKYEGMVLDSDQALLYEFNIRDGSVVHVTFARFCVLTNKAGKKMDLGYHHELDYFHIFKLACRFYEKLLSENTVFSCKCGRNLSAAEGQQRLSVDCCRPRHRRMPLTVHRNITVRFHLRQNCQVFRVTSRTDETLGAVTEKLLEAFPIAPLKDVQLLTEKDKPRTDLNKTLYDILDDDRDSLLVPFEKKMKINFEIKQRTFSWIIWPSDFLSTVMEDVQNLIKDISQRSLESLEFHGRKVTEPENRELLEFLRFSHLGILEDERLVCRTRNLRKTNHTTPKAGASGASPAHLMAREPPPNHNITIAIGEDRFPFQIFVDTDSAASLCARLCREQKARLCNATFVGLPQSNTKIYPHESKWWSRPLMDREKSDTSLVLSVGRASAVRIIVIAINPVGSPMSFFVRSQQGAMAEVIKELEHRQLRKGWFTQVGRRYEVDHQLHHGIATVIGNSQNTFFITEDGVCNPPKMTGGSVFISNISSSGGEDALTIPPFGDPKIEVYVHTVFLKASQSVDQPPLEVRSLEECFTQDVFVYMRGVRLTSKRLFCPSLFSGKTIDSNSGKNVKLSPDEKNAENFVLVFDDRAVVPKLILPPHDDVRLFCKAGFEVSFQDGRFYKRTSDTLPVVHNRWIAEERNKTLTKSLSVYLRTQ